MLREIVEENLPPWRHKVCPKATQPKLAMLWGWAIGPEPSDTLPASALPQRAWEGKEMPTQVKRNFSPPPATHRLVLGSSCGTSAVLQPSHSVGQPKPAGRETPTTKRIFWALLWNESSPEPIPGSAWAASFVPDKFAVRSPPSQDEQQASVKSPLAAQKVTGEGTTSGFAWNQIFYSCFFFSPLFFFF